jgi:hypothetical protein
MPKLHARHRHGTIAWTACMAVPGRTHEDKLSSSSWMAMRDSSFYRRRASFWSPSTRVRSASVAPGAAPGLVMCSTVSARRPSMTAVYENRCAETVPASMRPALTSIGSSVTATCAQTWVRVRRSPPSPSASSISGARATQLHPIAGSVPSARARPVVCETHDVEQHERNVVRRVIHEFLHQRRIDPPKPRPDIVSGSTSAASPAEYRWRGNELLTLGAGASVVQPPPRPRSSDRSGGHRRGYHVLARRQRRSGIIVRATGGVHSPSAM